MKHSNDFSNLVTALVIILGFFLSALAVNITKRVKEIPKRKLTQTPAQAYAKMVHAIADAAVPKDLDKIDGMLVGFKLEFTGYLTEAEIKNYEWDVAAMRKEKRFVLLLELRDSQLQIV